MIARPPGTVRMLLCVLGAAAAAGRCPAQPAALAALQESLEQSIAKAEKSVVAIARVRQGAALAPGDPSFVPNEFATGVVIGRRGLILTAYHVLGDPQQNDYWVWLRGTPYRVLKVQRPRAADPWLDLAVLQIGAEDLTPIAMGDARRLKKGQLVVALGNPHAIARDGEVSASLGIVSNLRRKAPPLPGQETRETLHQLGTLVQIDARLPRGASGGALINLSGEMVGLTLSLTALAEEESEGGFAIPVDDTFQRAVKAMQQGNVEDYGYLGVLPAALPLARRREGRRGVAVQHVLTGTPAELSGLRRLDVIDAVDGQPVADPEDLVRLVSSRTAGEQVRLQVLRGEGPRPARLQLDVTLSKKRVAGPLPVISEQPPRRWRGAVVEYMTAMPDYPFHSYKIDPRGCVGLLEVDRDSPVGAAGFRGGDYVSHVEGRRVRTPREFLDAVADRAGPLQLRRPASRGREAEELTVAP